MSYDVYLKNPSPLMTTEEPDDLPGPTYNLTPIFDRALTNEELPNPDISEFEAVLLRAPTGRPRGLRVLNGRKASDTVRQLVQANFDLNDKAKEEMLRTLEPENKWGTLEDARTVIKELLEAAQAYPDNIWEVH